MCMFSAPADYDGQMDIMPSDIYDIDTEQLQARYDPRLLSEDVSGYHSTANEEGTACRNSNSRYVHGQKVHHTQDNILYTLKPQHNCNRFQF